MNNATKLSQRLHAATLLCLTQDGLAWSHAEQARRLCAGGARWIQLRMKNADTETWIRTAREVSEICRRHGVLCIVNDSVEVALAAGADGVHLGRNDTDWIEARRLLGPDRILGGTVNRLEDAEHARDSNVLDYVGIGPWRFTRNKINLAPILGPAGIAALLPVLKDIPAWAIGGIEADDLPAIKNIGCAGAALSSVLFRKGEIEQNVSVLLAGWQGAAKAADPISAVGTRGAFNL